MDQKEVMLMKYQAEQEYSKRQVLQSINILRGILNRIETSVNSGDVRADDGLQGNEWILYKELSNLEQLNKMVNDLNKLD